MIRTASGFFLAVLVTYISAVIFVSQWNIASVVQLGLPVGMSVRFAAAFHDLANMLGIYLPVIGIGLLIAFVVAWLLVKCLPKLPHILYPLAGFVALLTVHITLKLVFDVSAVAPTRHIAGLLSQAVAGGLGGYVFYRMLQPTDTDQ